MTRHVLDLFCGLGGFSAAFADSEDWSVTTVDIEARFDPDIQADVMDLRPSDLPDADVVLASPPCTEFSPAQNLNGDHDPDPDHITLAYHTLGIIHGIDPDYWFLENPWGRLRSYIGTPTATVTYCQYGERTMKPTDLWGDHPPMTYRRCSRGDSCHVNTREGSNELRKDGRTTAQKAVVPYNLSEAICKAVDAAYAGEAYEQETLGGMTQ